MTERLPLVLASGQIQQLQTGDTIAGSSNSEGRIALLESKKKYSETIQNYDKVESKVNKLKREINEVRVLALSGGQQQTPWVSDIDGASYDLSNIGTINDNKSGPSNNVKYNNDSDVTTLALDYVLLKSIPITAKILGTTRILYDNSMEINFNSYGFTQIRRNGTEVLSSEYLTHAQYPNYYTYVHDITQDWQVGDTLELWGYSETGVMLLHVKNFKMCYDRLTSIEPNNRQLIASDGSDVAAQWGDGTLKDGAGNPFLTSNGSDVDGRVKIIEDKIKELIADNEKNPQPDIDSKLAKLRKDLTSKIYGIVSPYDDTIIKNDIFNLKGRESLLEKQNYLKSDVVDLTKIENSIKNINKKIPQILAIAQSGSQTPWVTTIDADSNDLNNLGKIDGLSVGLLGAVLAELYYAP